MSFELLQNGVVYLEDVRSGSTFYRLHVGREVSFSQTFRQEGIAKRTLHSQKDLFDGSVINTANPADFSFTLLLVKETVKHQHIPLDFLIGYNAQSTLDTFNFYFINTQNNPDVQYKIESCVFTSGVFNIPRSGFMTVTLTGQGTKLTRSTGTYNISSPGFITTANTKFAISKEYKAIVNSNTLTNFAGASIELQNNIQWLDNTTIQATRNAVDASSSVYPSNFVLTDRSLGGSIQQYVVQSNAQSVNNLLTWKDNVPVSIKAGNSSTDYQLQIDMTGCSFTNRPVVGDVFSQSYDFRLASNPSNLSSFFTY